MGALPPFEAPFQTPESPPVPRAEALCSLPACSNESFAFGTGGRTHPSPHGGRHEVRPRVLPFVRTPARRRWDCRGLYERGSGPPLFFCFIPVCSDSIPCALRAGERGLESPPLPRAEALCSLPACSDPSFAFGTGGRIHPSPHGGGGMKSGQGCYPLCVPRPAVGGIAGVRARPETPQTLGRVVRREGCRHDVGLGRAPPGRPRRFFFSSPPGGRRG